MKYRFLLLLVMFIFVSSPVFALAISPGSYYTNFKPGEKESFTVRVINTIDGWEDIGVGMEIDTSTNRKDFIQYTTPSVNRVKIPPRGTMDVNFTVQYPSELEPGEYFTYLTFAELGETPTSGIVARIVIRFSFTVYSPYPGKYIDIDFQPPEFIKQKEDGEFKIRVISRGKENISGVKGKIDILSPDGVPIKTLTLSEVPLPAQTEQVLKALWTANVEPGVYYANALVTYDSGFKTDSKSFRVGDISIKIAGIYTENIKKASVGKFVVSLENYWNTKIDGVYVKGEIYKDGRKIYEIKSETFQMDPWSSKNVSLFWDTTNFDPGTYEGKFTVYYAEKTDESSILFEIKDDSLLYLIAGLIAIIILIAVMIYIYRKKGNRGSK